jgi:hypothetical protein
LAKSVLNADDGVESKLDFLGATIVARDRKAKLAAQPVQTGL